jgi:hypothetical protein
MVYADWFGGSTTTTILLVPYSHPEKMTQRNRKENHVPFFSLFLETERRKASNLSVPIRRMAHNVGSVHKPKSIKLVPLFIPFPLDVEPFNQKYDHKADDRSFETSCPLVSSW